MGDFLLCNLNRDLFPYVCAFSGCKWICHDAALVFLDSPEIPAGNGITSGVCFVSLTMAAGFPIFRKWGF